MKNLIVFGPTGRTGLAVLERASNDPDFEVTAFLRKPKKVPEKVREKIKIVVGDVLFPDQVANALEGQDVVISCLGKGFNLGHTTVISNGIRNIIDGMRKHGIRHITVVGVSSLMSHIREPFPLKRIGADHRRAYAILQESEDIDWICTAPPEIANLPHTGTLKAQINHLDTRVVTTHDLADWMLQCSKDPLMAREFTHQLVGVSSSISLYTRLTQTAPGIMMIATIALLCGSSYLIYRNYM